MSVAKPEISQTDCSPITDFIPRLDCNGGKGGNAREIFTPAISAGTRKIPPQTKKERHTHLIVINEECQFCESTAVPVSCSKCYALVCADCIDNFDGRPVCSFCRNELEHPRRLAKVLMFSVGATSRHVQRVPTKSPATRVATKRSNFRVRATRRAVAVFATALCSLRAQVLLTSCASLHYI